MTGEKKINPEYYSQQKYSSITNKKWWYFQFKKKLRDLSLENSYYKEF